MARQRPYEQAPHPAATVPERILFTNLQNYGIDQNYIQRYMTARDEKGAKNSTLLGGLLYVPVSLVFVYIGTALFVYYKTSGTLPQEIAGDRVFPYFIVHSLPTGVTGLMIHEF